MSCVGFSQDQDVVEEFASMVPMTRSQWAFIRGACGALVTTRRSSAWKTASNAFVVLAVAIAEQEAQGLHPVSEVGGEVSGLLRRPFLGWVGGGASDVKVPGAVFEERKCVEAFAECGVDVEEVRRDDALGLGGGEFPPGRPGTAGYRAPRREPCPGPRRGWTRRSLSPACRQADVTLRRPLRPRNEEKPVLSWMSADRSTKARPRCQHQA